MPLGKYTMSEFKAKMKGNRVLGLKFVLQQYCNIMVVWGWKKMNL